MSRESEVTFAEGPLETMQLYVFAFCYFFFDQRLELIDPLPHFTLGFFRSCLEPQVIDLREDAVLAGHPAVAEGFPVGLGGDRRGFLLQRSQQLLSSLVQGGGGEAF